MCNTILSAVLMKHLLDQRPSDHISKNVKISNEHKHLLSHVHLVIYLIKIMLATHCVSYPLVRKFNQCLKKYKLFTKLI